MGGVSDCATRHFSLSLYERDQLISQLLSLTAGRQVVDQMCLELCYRQPNNLLHVLTQEINSLNAQNKDQNKISCYNSVDLGLP